MRDARRDLGPLVLVTGAPGWLGTRLVEVLRCGLPELRRPAGGAPVRCLLAPGAEAGVLERVAPGVELVEGDLRDREAVRRLCAGARAATVFHAAATVHPLRHVREFREVNVEGTRNLLEAAAEARVRRFVAVSSNSPTGYRPPGSPLLDERAPYCPYMGYGRSKAEAERLVRQAHARGELETAIVRPPWFYGPHQPDRQTRFFRLIRSGRFPLLGDGRQRRSMAYVDNVCQGLLLAAASPRAAGETYWIADERPYELREIVETVADVLEQEFGIPCAARRLRLPAWIGTAAGLADAALQGVGLYHQQIHVLGELGKEIACSIEKARAELGYAPGVALREGMAASIRWCLENGRTL